MPRYDDDLEVISNPNAGSHFGFSGTRVNRLGASEYTLAQLTIDATPSVSGFADDLNKVAKAVIEMLARSPRADNLLVRYNTFNDRIGVPEVHGFRLLEKCSPDDYLGTVVPGGSGTNLYDADLDGLDAIFGYGEKLADEDYMTNAIQVIVTDGGNNNSHYTLNSVIERKNRGQQTEKIESLFRLLIGVNINDAYVKRELEDYRDHGMFDQFEMIENASKENLAKVAGFISKSVSSASQSLGTGGASQPLAF